MRFSRCFTTAFLAVALLGCSDGPVSIDAGSGRLLFAPQFSYSGLMAAEAIERVRMRPLLFPGNDPLGSATTQGVGADDAEWTLFAAVDLAGRDSATVMVEVEMLSLAGGVEVVEWSGRVGPVMVRAGHEASFAEPVTLLRGPLANQGVQGVVIEGPSQMVAGQSHPARAIVEGSADGHTVLWTSSDETVATVDATGDSVMVRAGAAGETFIVAAAGLHADTLSVAVEALSTGEVGEVLLFPDSVLMVPGASRTFIALANDSAGQPLDESIGWESLHPDIASVSQTGVVTAEAPGVARIVASAGGFADTAVVVVENLPAGIDLVWQGGTPGVEDDWFTADNWSPAQVPNATTTIYLPGGGHPLRLTADAEVGGIVSAPDWFSEFGIGEWTLTAHGDVDTPWGFTAGSTGRLVLAGDLAITGSLPSTTILGGVRLGGQVVVGGDVLIDGSNGTAYLETGDSLAAVVTGSMTVINAHLRVSENVETGNAGFVWVYGDLLIDGGDSRGHLVGGEVIVGGDLTVTDASCNALASDGTLFYLFADSSRLSIGCSGLESNHFHDLVIYDESAGDRILHLDSDVHLAGEIFLFASGWARVVGSGQTMHVAGGSVRGEFDGVLLDSEIADPLEYLYADSLVFSGMAGMQAPQLRLAHPGEPCDCSTWQTIVFDPSSAGPYLEMIDTDGVAQYFQIALPHNPGDGPERTIVSGGAQAHWGDVPHALLHWSGDGQTGPSGEPLADSLVVQAIDYFGEGLGGVVVDWQQVTGDGSVSPTTSTTDAATGLAATQWTLGTGVQRVIATAAALPADTIAFDAASQATVARPGSTDAGGAVIGPSAGTALRSGRATAQRRQPEMPSRPTRPAWARGSSHTGERR